MGKTRDPMRRRGRGRKRTDRTRQPRFGTGPAKGWLDYLKLGAVITVAAVYSYALFLQPLLGENAPFGSVFGTSLTRLAGASLQSLKASAQADQCGIPLGVMWPVHSPGGGPVNTASVFPVFADAAGQPVSADEADLLYGAVAEQNLPWHGQFPERLAELQRQTGAEHLIAAFRTTLPNPLWDERSNVAQAAQYLSGTVLQPGEAVSLIGVIGPFTAARGYGDGPGYAGNRVVPTDGGGVCKIATAVYNAAVHSDLTVLERKPHSMLVPYVPPGRDAAIATGSKDVRIRNDNDTPVVFWAGMEDTTLFVAVYGQHERPLIEWFHEESDRHRAEPIRRANRDLPSGTEQRVIEGYDGVTIRTWIVIKRTDRPDERRDMGVDTYRPLPGVIEYGP